MIPITATDQSRFPPPSRWEMRGVYVLIATAIVFAFAVEMRSAFMARRMTDLGVYLRAAWAVRSGENIYDVTDTNNWHYNYPPLFAILMTPLAKAPADVDGAASLPFTVSVLIWYAFGVVCLIVAVHVLATSLEKHSLVPEVPAGCRRWWSLRLIPILACLIPVAHTLMRGQVNLLLLALFCIAIAALIRGQNLRAGIWLAGAICLKVIPAFLLLVPLWRRDYRCLAGTAIGLLIGLFIIPAAVFGVPKTLSYYRQYDQILLRPGLGGGGDESRSTELLGATSNDSQSIMSAIHNSIYPDRDARPLYASSSVRWAHRVIAVLLTGLTLIAARWKRTNDAINTVLLFGALTMVMLLISPVCHMHYFAVALPLVMGLVAVTLEHTGPPHRIGVGLPLTFGVFFLTMALPHLPGLQILRDRGLGMCGGLLLWIIGCACLWKQARRRTGVMPVTGERLAA